MPVGVKTHHKTLFLLERMVPINAVCEANLEKMGVVLKEVLDKKWKDLGDPSEYYIMPRSRFHKSIERDHILDLVKETMTTIRPDCQLNWKNYKESFFEFFLTL